MGLPIKASFFSDQEVTSDPSGPIRSIFSLGIRLSNETSLDTLGSDSSLKLYQVCGDGTWTFVHLPGALMFLKVCVPDWFLETMDLVTQKN